MIKSTRYLCMIVKSFLFPPTTKDLGHTWKLECDGHSLKKKMTMKVSENRMGH